MADLNAFTLESAASMVAGTARSMGITIEGAPAK
jgi:large subunit ribosomal protein L11